MIWRTIASQNTGKLTVPIEIKREKWSGQRSRQRAEMMASGMPISRPISVETMVNSSVAVK
jgi:hypothetical protein